MFNVALSHASRASRMTGAVALWSSKSSAGQDTICGNSGEFFMGGGEGEPLHLRGRFPDASGLWGKSFNEAVNASSVMWWRMMECFTMASGSR